MSPWKKIALVNSGPLVGIAISLFIGPQQPNNIDKSIDLTQPDKKKEDPQ
jgi:hypothetical protein